MTVIIACIFIGGISGYLYSRQYNAEYYVGTKTMCASTGMLLGLFVGVFLLPIILENYLSTTIHQFEFEKAKLFNLDSARDLQGSSFLTLERVGTEQYYKFYYKTADGGKKFDKIEAGRVTVYEEDRNNAYIAKAGKKTRYSKNAYRWLLMSESMVGEFNWEYVIHVPKGTIKVKP